jgi:hypothetical protein
MIIPFLICWHIHTRSVENPPFRALICFYSESSIILVIVPRTSLVSSSAKHRFQICNWFAILWLSLLWECSRWGIWITHEWLLPHERAKGDMISMCGHTSKAEIWASDKNSCENFRLPKVAPYYRVLWPADSINFTEVANAWHQPATLHFVVMMEVECFYGQFLTLHQIKRYQIPEDNLSTLMHVIILERNLLINMEPRTSKISLSMQMGRSRLNKKSRISDLTEVRLRKRRTLFHDLSLSLPSSLLLFISDLFISLRPKQMSCTLSCGDQRRISQSNSFICLSTLRSPDCGFSPIAQQCYWLYMVVIIRVPSGGSNGCLQ